MKIDKKFIKKVLPPIFQYKKLNKPVPALLITLCIMESLSSQKRKRIESYIKTKMLNTYKQLLENDNLRKSQISKLDCSELHPKQTGCKNSLDLLYHHLRCVLVHDFEYVNDINNGVFITNRQNKKQIHCIVEKLKGYRGKDLTNYALIINAPAFITEFLETF